MRKLRLREVTSLLQYHTVIILGGSEGITITFSKTIINFQRVTNAPRIIRSGISLKLKYFTENCFLWRFFHNSYTEFMIL